MASEVLPDGSVVAPLNITAPAPVLDLKGFKWSSVDEIDGIRAGDELRSHLQVKAVPAGLGFQRPGGPPGGFPGGFGPPHGFPHGGGDPAPAPPAPAPPAPVPPAPAPAPVAEDPLPEQLSKQLELDHKNTNPGPFFPIEQFNQPFAGNGFNMIFRPRSNKSDKVGGNGPTDNVLQVNLTLEQISFGHTIGDIPNRGLFDQDDIILAGLPYLQTVQDSSNATTGKGDNIAPIGIHFEPGMWLNVPPANFQNSQASVVRMASIPHGTTINAQGIAPTKNPSTVTGGEPGGPKFDVIDTTPFGIGSDPSDPSSRITNTFNNMLAEQPGTRRIPQDLTSFINAKTITTDIIKNPNLVLAKAIEGLDISETISFQVNTGPGPPKAAMNAGGAANIAFLSGKEILPQSPPNLNPQSNAHVPVMSASYWIERVNYDVIVPLGLKGNQTLSLKPTMPDGSTAPTPVFAITTPPQGTPPVSGGQTQMKIKVPGVQIQVSQTVLLNFAGLSWPHVSVSTLVPTRAQTFQMK